MAKRVPAPGWHLPQVVARFALLTIERGSDDGRIRCTPWHEAQLATVLLPARDERPWKLSSKDETTLLGRLNFSVTRRSPWQGRQVGGEDRRAGVFDRKNAVLAVAVGADRRLVGAVGHGLAVDARLESFLDAGMAGAAGVRHVLAVHLRLRIRRRQDAVTAVARGAGG